MARGRFASVRRVLLYQIILVPGFLFPLGTVLSAYDVGSPTTTAAVVTAAVSFLVAAAGGDGRTRDVVAFSTFSLGGYVLAATVSTAVVGSPTSTVDALLVAFGFGVGAMGVWLARDGRLDGFARAARAGPR